MSDAFYLDPLRRSQTMPYGDIITGAKTYNIPLSYFPKTSDFGSGYLGLCVVLFALFLLLNLKCFPGIWHMRILNAARFVLRTQRPAVALNPSLIFQPLITTSEAQLLEIDFNCHKNNSTYFSDIDISRAHLACTLFANGIEKVRGGTSAYVGTSNRNFGLALGAVSCSFKKEITPYERYEMWSKILSWDKKWIYIVTHFVREGTAKPRCFSLYPQDQHSRFPKSASAAPGSKRVFCPEKDLFATALSKCVFKAGRETITPKIMFGLSGLLSPAMEESEREHIENQRKEGYRIASILAAENQKAMEAEFGLGDGDALGKHTDGTGLPGVVSTLMQLAGLKRTQAL